MKAPSVLIALVDKERELNDSIVTGSRIAKEAGGGGGAGWWVGWEGAPEMRPLRAKRLFFSSLRVDIIFRCFSSCWEWKT